MRKGWFHKHPADLTLTDSYKEYRKGIERGTCYDVPVSQYIDTCTRFNEKLWDLIHLKGMTIRMYPSIGDYYVSKYKVRNNNPRKMRVNWGASKEAGKIVYYTHEHTNGYRYYHKWNKKHVHYMIFVDLYQFIAQEKWKRRLFNLVVREHKDFFE